MSLQQILDVIKLSQQQENRTFKQKYVNKFINQWYNNNTLVRYEFPISEGDSGVHQIFHMFTELCKNRPIPDMDFFVNKRDFPLLTNDNSESYNEIYHHEFNNRTQSNTHNYDSYCPVLSMTSTQYNSDICIPTWEDWSRVINIESGSFFPKPIKNFKFTFNTNWNQKKDIAVFRGASTGKNIDVNLNQRLKLAKISHDLNDLNTLNAGITSWNCRPRLVNEKNKLYLKTIDIKSLPFSLVNFMSPEEQSNFKYIINVDGHSKAYRLSLELSMGSVILLVDSNYTMWFMKFLKPYHHYIPIKEDLSDLIDKINWCKQNDETCKNIAENALLFYNTYLSKNGIFDYLQWILVNINIISGNPIIFKNSLSYSISHNNSIFYSQNTNTINTIIQNLKNSNFNNLTIDHNLLETINNIITVCVKLPSFSNLLCNISNIYKNNSYELLSCNFLSFNKSLLIKKYHDTSKLQELNYSFFVGKQINKLLNICSNFCTTITCLLLDFLILHQMIHNQITPSF